MCVKEENCHSIKLNPQIKNVPKNLIVHYKRLLFTGRELVLHLKTLLT